MRVIQRFTVLGVLIVGGVVGSAQQGHASLSVHLGDVYCHAEAAGPRYFHSEITAALREMPQDDDWWPTSEEVRRRLERRALEYLAAEFAGYVAENHEVEHLLSPRCEMTEAGSGTMEVERASYARGGELLSYEVSQRTAVDWSPDFRGVFRRLAVAQSERIALVIGNGAYSSATAMRPLPSAVNDARDVGAALERLGFDTTVLLDADRNALNGALLAFSRQAAGADIALVFYSGGGVETEGVNYVIPVDARLETPAEVSFETVALDTVVAAATGARVPIVIVDACRDNPFAARVGLEQIAGAVVAGPVDAGDFETGVLVAYATTAGGLAFERGWNGVYTAALLEHLEESGLEVETMFRRVGATVAANTDGRQRPVVYSTLIESDPIRLADPEPGPAAVP